MTPYRKHVMKWKDCRRCSLCKQRHRVVIARGRVPCNVLFIGEAPGVSEDALGKPFVGPAGKLLDKIIEQGMSITVVEDGEEDAGVISHALTNLVCCFPREAKESGNHEPPEEAIEACAARLREFVELCNPDLVVRVGSLADKWAPDFPDSHQVSILHPAAVLRMDVSKKGLAIQRTIVALADAVEGLGD